MTESRFTGIRAVLFDLDGTLIDSAPDLGAAAERMRLDRGLPSLEFAQYRPLAGAGARGMLRVALGVTPEHAGYEALKEEFLTYYSECMLERTEVFQGVAALVSALMDCGLVWGVVTNKAQRFTLPLTQSMDLFGSASTIISGDTTAHAKPHPEPLLEAARRLSLLPEQCMYVGDDERDIVAGRSAGMVTVAAHYGYLGQGACVASWGAHAEISSPFQVLNLLDLP